jgi:hypothetical protein
MSKNTITSYSITPKPKKLNSLQPDPKLTCQGYDVDASEDGCSIVLCDCQICTTKKTEQLQFLVEEINHVGKDVIDANSTLTIHQMFENIKKKIEQINQNKQVYGTGSGR